MELYRELNTKEEAQFRKWARDNYNVEQPIGNSWHPVIKDECNKMLFESRHPVEEKIKYPTQQEADDMADWFNHSNMFKASSLRVNEAVMKADFIRVKIHQEIFGDNSPYSCKIDNRSKKTKKVVAYWDSAKAKKLGIE